MILKYKKNIICILLILSTALLYLNLLDMAKTIVSLFIFIIPLLITFYEICIFFEEIKKLKYTNFLFQTIFDLIAIFYSLVLLNLFLTLLIKIDFTADYFIQLYNDIHHTPINTNSYPIVIIIIISFIISITILNLNRINTIPPLIGIFSISSLYIGFIFTITFFYHTFAPLSTYQGKNYNYNLISYLFIILPFLIPVNLFFICGRLIIKNIKIYNNKMLFNRIRLNKINIPIFAFILMIPLMGLYIIFSLLFKQEPDSIIKAFTKTSEYRLSKKISPPNIYYDEHYLCTVAAQGHRHIVKPLRMGYRHGHKIIVNRQLLIANAFENLLEEKIPSIHKVIRNFYDKYGFPIAKLINTKVKSDIVYFLMKPLEYFFLFILYLFDTKPENRIHMQYIK